MKFLTFTLAVFIAHNLYSQNKNTIFYDSLNQVTTWEGHWAQVVTGRYKSIYHKSENKKTLARTSNEEFESEIRKTEKRIRAKQFLGTDFPDFSVVDIDGNHISKTDLEGKVIVFNFWFIGCGPCEIERPSLNDLTKIYTKNDHVIFISFARNNEEELKSFMKEHPMLYKVIATDKDFIESKFKVGQYPTNIVVDRHGKYAYNSTGSGIGILKILKQEIENALAE